MPKLWKNGAGRILRSPAGAVLTCAECPCDEPGDDCTHCTPGRTPREIALTIRGVTGCNGRCDVHNLTVVLTQVAPCTWSATEIFPQPTDAPGSLCESLVGNVLGAAEVLLTGSGGFELRIFDEVFGGFLVEVFFTGTFSGECDTLDLTLSDPEIDTYGTMGFACPEIGCETWCDWSSAEVDLLAL